MRVITQMPNQKTKMLMIVANRAAAQKRDADARKAELEKEGARRKAQAAALLAGCANLADFTPYSSLTRLACRKFGTLQRPPPQTQRPHQLRNALCMEIVKFVGAESPAPKVHAEGTPTRNARMICPEPHSTGAGENRFSRPDPFGVASSG
jgi:hypothetical protein